MPSSVFHSSSGWRPHSCRRDHTYEQEHISCKPLLRYHQLVEGRDLLVIKTCYKASNCFNDPQNTLSVLAILISVKHAQDLPIADSTHNQSQFALSTDVLWLSNEQYLALVVLVVLSKNESHEVLCIFASFGALFRCCRCHVTKVQFHPAYYNLWSECG